jgi:arylsulfatase A-like enzyme
MDKSKKQNIVWFVADQMRSDSLAHLGNPASVTPNLDRVAAEGVSFRNAYCQNPVCVPSRCSFLTGLYPHTTGHRTMHYMMRPDEPSLLQTMKDAGYEVVWIGRNDFVPGAVSKAQYCDRFYDGTDLENKVNVVGGKMHMTTPPVQPEVMPPMQNVDNHYSFYTGRYPAHSLDHTFDWNCVQAALNYLDERSRQPDAKPFFIYCTLCFPHPPYGCEEPWYSLIDRTKLPPRRPELEHIGPKSTILTAIRSKQNMQDWGEEQYNEMRAVYLGMVARFDHQLGMLTDKLREVGEYDNTNLFVFSDHGDLTGDYGIAEKCQNSFEDPLTNVPLLVKPAQGVPFTAGVHEQLVALVDLPATVSELTGVPLGYVQFGQSLLPALAGGAGRDAVFCEGGRVRGEWQAMEPEHGPASAYWPRVSSQHEEGPAHTKGCMIRMGELKYTMRLYEQDELYDLARDPMELTNRINDPDYADRLQALRMRLLQFYMETGDYVPPRMDKR